MKKKILFCQFISSSYAEGHLGTLFIEDVLEQYMIILIAYKYLSIIIHGYNEFILSLVHLCPPEIDVIIRWLTFKSLCIVHYSQSVVLLLLVHLSFGQVRI